MAKVMGAMPADDYQAQDDVRTLMAAHKIKSDPKRHAAAKAHGKAQLAAMQAMIEAKEPKADKESKAEDRAEMKGAK